MRFVVLGLCAVGLYVSIYMQRKAMDARDGTLAEASVVQTNRARLVGGVPNSLIGICYYIGLAIVSFGLSAPAVYLPALIAVSLAAAMSLYLAYSLLFVTKMPCVYCWTGHVVNWALLVVFIFVK